MRTDKWLLVAMAATWLVAGAVEAHLPHGGELLSEIAVPHTVVLAILFFAWCKAHAAARGIVPPTYAPLLVGIIAPIGIPYYFLRGFGWRKGSVLFLLAICTFTGFILLYLVSFMLSARVGT
jgi:hypothetical protein